MGFESKRLRKVCAAEDVYNSVPLLKMGGALSSSRGSRVQGGIEMCNEMGEIKVLK